jgi:hypothetical protein
MDSLPSRGREGRPVRQERGQGRRHRGLEEAEGGQAPAARQERQVSDLGAARHDTLDGARRRARPPGPAWTSAGLSAIDSSGIQGEFSAIPLGTDGLGVISYSDGTGAAQDLKVAHCGNVACTTSSYVAVDTPGQVGWNTSITIGSDGVPYDSYRDVSGNSVTGLHCPNVFCVAHHRRR